MKPKIVTVDVNGTTRFQGKGAVVRGQVTVQYADLSNWVITSVGLDLFHEKGEDSYDGTELWDGIVPHIADRYENEIEDAIRKNENV
jgi:hypothetical protein